MNKNRVCHEFLRTIHNRRSFLTAGAFGGLSLGSLFRRETNGSPPASLKGGPTKNIILLWMRGGPSHIDMWDPKPEATAEIRGEFGVARTPVAGIQLTDMLPKCAKVMDRWSIIRSLHHGNAGHSAGDQICFTGYAPGADPNVNVMPSCGSIVAKQLGPLSPQLPSYVMIPRAVPGVGSAFLGPAYRPFETVADPASNAPFTVPNFKMSQGLSVQRLGSRRELQAGLDRLRREVDHRGEMEAVDRFDQQAWEILSSPAAQQAFDLEQEPAAIRERYGFMPAFDPGASDRCGAPAWSQRILLARRLVEAGVRLVTVDLRWWDTHVQGFDSLRRGFLPRFDQAYSALIEDLDQRGLLESTLVVAWGEFGRTPRVNKNAGRDHYPNVFSAAIAGGKVQGGRVVGGSDSKGAFPKDNPKTPQDVLATMYDHVGVDTTTQYVSASGRPSPVLPHGAPIDELF